MRNDENGLFVAYFLDCDVLDAREAVATLAIEAFGCVFEAEAEVMAQAGKSFELTLPDKPVSPQPESVRLGAYFVRRPPTVGEAKSEGEGVPMRDDEEEQAENTSHASNEEDAQRSLAGGFIDYVLSFLHLTTLRRHTKRSSNCGEFTTSMPYFRVLTGFVVKGGLQSSKYLHSHKVLPRLLDLYLANHSPFPDITPNFPKNANGTRWEWMEGVDLTSYLEILQLMVNFYHPLVVPDPESNQALQAGSLGGAASAGVQIDRESLDILGSEVFLRSFLSHADTKQKAASVCQIVSYLSDSNKEVRTTSSAPLSCLARFMLHVGHITLHHHPNVFPI